MEALTYGALETLMIAQPESKTPPKTPTNNNATLTTTATTGGKHMPAALLKCTLLDQLIYISAQSVAKKNGRSGGGGGGKQAQAKANGRGKVYTETETKT